MLNEFFQSQAALYAAGAMTAEERDRFELVLEFHHELRELVTELAEVGAAVMLGAKPPAGVTASPELKARLSGLVADLPQHSTPVGMVVCGSDHLVQWINPAFGEMCGYTIEELRGKNLGPILQGPGTDPDSAARMRHAVHENLPCCETILNYHKNGTPYWVEIAITPVFDDAGQPLYLVAREREVTERLAA